MKFLKRLILGLIIILALASVLIVITGHSHLFKAVASTYLKGRTGPSIDEHAIFESRAVEVGKHQPWKTSEHYNKVYDKELLTEIEKFNPAAFLVIKHDEIAYEKYWGRLQ